MTVSGAEQAQRDDGVCPAAPQGYKRTDAGVVPVEWDVQPLLSVLRIANGQVNPRREPYRSMILVAPDHIESGTGRLLDRKSAADQGAISGKYQFSSGDIVYSKIRPYLRKAILAEFDGLCSADMYPLTPADGIDPAYMLAVLLGHRFSTFAESVSVRSGMPKINRSELSEFVVAIPRPDEQRAIAEVLSDVDGLLGALEKLIAKKRAIKQAAMQQLLSGKTRLPGFTGKWVDTKLGDIAHIKTGSRNNKDKVEDGQYPFFVRSDTVERIDTYSYDCEAIVVPGEGGIGSIFHYINGKFDLHQRVYKISHFPVGVCGKFIYYTMVQWFGQHAMRNTVKATVDSLRLPTFQNFMFAAPSDHSEQTAIAAVLSDMDAEIQSLERRRDKVKQIKQGMMQQLLTGHIRLVKPEVVQVPATRSEADEKGIKSHSWAFNEAVVISTLAKHFGKDEFPLGRKRYTKLSYLLHRRTERQAEGYLKKAAGPYNPKTKYGGPERIALESGYIREHKNGPYTGFVAADNIAQAETYFEKWYGLDAIQWLNQFRFKKKDDLELLATVDMASEELRAGGQKVDVINVKTVIRSHPEWKAKLDRAVFSDANIAKAIDECRKLFGCKVEY